MKMRIFAVVAAVAVLSACGKSAEQKAAEDAAKAVADATKAASQQGTQGLAQGLQQLAQGLQQTGTDGKPVPPIDFEKLEALEPDAPSGWEKGKSSGQTTSMGVSVSTAEVTYTKGDSDVKLTITDAAFNQLIMAPFSMMLAMGYSERTSDGYKKATTVKGNPAFETWENNNKHGEVGVIVGKRFIVQATGSTISSIDIVRQFVESVDLSKLAGLK